MSPAASGTTSQALGPGTGSWTGPMFVSVDVEIVSVDVEIVSVDVEIVGRCISTFYYFLLTGKRRFVEILLFLLSTTFY